MKDIKDYKGTKTLIQVNSNEEYLELMPLLNTVFSGWDHNVYIHNTEDSRSNTIYIDCYLDAVEENPIEGYEILQSSDFLQSKPQMKEKDVKKDNFYYAEYKPGDFAIIKTQRDGSLDGSGFIKEEYYKLNSWSCDKNIREATKEERHHLECCIKENRFVPKEEALKSLNRFEAGRWYKVELNNKFNHFVKFKSVKNNTAYLDDLGYIADLRKWYHGTSIDLTDVTKLELLTDLSEIQQFLPLGHPDKLPTFKFNIGDKVNGKEGGWQFCNPESKDALKSIKSIKFSFNDIVVNRKYTNNTNWYKLSDGGNWITEEGLELVEKENSVIPEYVECTRSSSKEYVVGKIYKVENEGVRTELGYLGFKKLPKSLLNHYDSHDFKPSTKEAYENQQLRNKHNLVVGKYYTYSVGNTTYWFRFAKLSNNQVYCNGYRDSTFRKNWSDFEVNLNISHISTIFTEVTEQEAKGTVQEEKWIPKVGDWVVVEDNKSYSINGKLVGQISRFKSENDYWVNNGKNLSNDWRGDIELCCDGYPFRKCLPHEIPNNQPKVSDNIQVIEYNPETQCIMYKGKDLIQNYTYSNWDFSGGIFKQMQESNSNLATPATITIKNRAKKEEKSLTKTRTKLTILKPKSITI